MHEKESILIVDDDEGTRRILELTFVQRGYTVQTAETGKDALEKAQSRFFNLALLDIRLPDTEGVDLLSPLKEMHPDMVVIMITAYASVETSVRAMNLGASAYITKPLKMDVVLATVRESLEKQHLSMENERLYREARQELAERKRAEEALRKSHQLLEKTFAGLHDAVFIIDADSGEITDCNPAASEMFGYSRQEMLGRTMNYLHVDETVMEKFRKYLYPLAQRKGFLSFLEFAMKSKDGTVFPTEQSLMPLEDEKGKRIGWVSIVRNITDRKRAEEALKAYSEQLEEMVEMRTKELKEVQDQLMRQEKLAVLGRLAGSVGHELRSPLSSIKDAAYFLNMTLEDPKPEVNEALSTLDKEVEISKRIISSLLDFAYPKPLNLMSIDVNKVVRDTLSRASIPDEIEVRSQLTETLPKIVADSDQFSRVLGHLILNAVQAMPEGGRLAVKTSAKAVEPSEVATPDWVTVSFVDKGEGIRNENIGKVFEPLFTTKANGIGLGLALSKMLVEAHGGTIDAKSEVGKGSTFEVRLPVG